MTGSEYGYVAQVKLVEQENNQVGNSSYLLKVCALYDKGTVKSKVDNESILATPNTLCGASLIKKKAMVYTRPSIDSTIPDPKPNLQNCCVIPLLKTPTVCCSPPPLSCSYL